MPKFKQQGNAEVQAERVDAAREVHTRYGLQVARAGDWIITDDQGLQVPMTDGEFRKRFAAADEDAKKALDPGNQQSDAAQAANVAGTASAASIQAGTSGPRAGEPTAGAAVNDQAARDQGVGRGHDPTQRSTTDPLAGAHDAAKEQDQAQKGQDQGHGRSKRP